MNAARAGRAALAGVILAGGDATRMGAPKEGVVMPDGRAMIEHVADALRPHVGALVVVGASRGYDPARLGARRLDDLRPGCGPLAGVEAALVADLADACLVVTCDQALLTAALLAALLPPDPSRPTVLRERGGEPLLPFPIVLPGPLAGSVGAALDAGERSVRRWLRSLPQGWDVRAVEAGDAARVRSLNSREEIAEALGDAVSPRGRGVR